MKKEDYSKNNKAKEIVGLRPTGASPFSLPCEMDYNCPICHRTCKICSKEQESEEIIHDESLHFSEYEGFMWCPKCNLDIPWCFCLRANTKEALDIYINRYLDWLKELKKVV